MSDAWGQANNATYPGHLDPWSKIKLGWVEPIKITSNGKYTMSPSEIVPNIYIIDDPYPDGEYLLIENRQAIHYDARIWTGGALIWHIDDKVKLNKNAGGPYQDGWPGNGNHYQVALVQADGKYELEQAINKGHEDDFYKSGRSILPGSAGITIAVFPNTDAYQDGNIRDTGLELVDFQKNGLSVSFTVLGLLEVSPTPAPVTLAPLPPDTTKCIVNVNLQLCSNHIENVQPQLGCDCYNFCGTGEGQRCCAFGEPCIINCHTGGLVAGCVKEANAILENIKIATTIDQDILKEMGEDFAPRFTPLESGAPARSWGLFLMPFTPLLLQWVLGWAILH
jgi:hypothetical protein